MHFYQFGHLVNCFNAADLLVFIDDGQRNTFDLIFLYKLREQIRIDHGCFDPIIERGKPLAGADHFRAVMACQRNTYSDFYIPFDFLDFFLRPVSDLLTRSGQIIKRQDERVDLLPAGYSVERDAGITPVLI